MTPVEFRTFIVDAAESEILDQCLRNDSVPYVFDEDEGAWNGFCAAIRNDIGALDADIRVVGSARLGFSLKPGNNLRPYTDTSDIDVVVVSPALFDAFWYSLLRAVYPRSPFTTGAVGGWLRERQKELYTGWLTPLATRIDRRIHGERADPVLQLSARWFTALRKASHHPRKRHEDITSRLYRSWEHAELYHSHSISALRATLAEE